LRAGAAPLPGDRLFDGFGLAAMFSEDLISGDGRGLRAVADAELGVQVA